MKIKTAIFVTILFIAAFVLVVIFGPKNGEVDSLPVEEQELSSDEIKPIQQTPFSAGELKMQVLEKGEGVAIEEGQVAFVHYVGGFTDGTVFDASDPEGEPFKFVLGQGAVISGWDIGVKDMKIGEKRRLVIPPEYAYGEAGYPPVIPPQSTLVFEVELVGIEDFVVEETTVLDKIEEAALVPVDELEVEKLGEEKDSTI